MFEDNRRSINNEEFDIERMYQNNNSKDSYLDLYDNISSTIKGDEQLRLKELLMGSPSKRERTYEPIQECSREEVVDTKASRIIYDDEDYGDNVGYENVQKRKGNKRTIFGIAFIAIIVAVVCILLVFGQNSVSFLDSLSKTVDADAPVASETVIIDEAAMTTMVFDNGKTIETVPVEAQADEQSSNWFDRACDWVNGIYGG